MNRATRANAALVTFSVISAAAFAAPPAESPFSQPQPAFYGQVRPRMELNHKILADTSHAAAYTLLRSRIGFSAVTSEFSEIKIELQDSRVLGSEPVAGLNQSSTTTGNAKGVDLSQGYGALEFLFGESNSLKAALGRMKMSLGAGRFLSTLEWSPTARQFDGLATNLRVDKLNVTGFGFQVRDTTNYASVLGNGAYTQLWGAYASLPLNDSSVLEAGVFYDLGRQQNQVPLASDITDNHDVATLDLRYAGKFGPVVVEQEFLYQTGEVGTAAKGSLDVAAWYSATRLGLHLPQGKLNVGVDAMSGDGDATDKEINQYRAQYWFGHNYFGWMDYFLNNPRYGVVDYRADLDIPVGEFASVKAQYHYFVPQIGTDLGKELDPYGQEIDLEIHVTRVPKTLLVFGAGVFLPGDGAFRLPAGLTQVANASVSTGTGYFVYFQPVFNF